MRKYYFKCEFKEPILSYTNDGNLMSRHTIIGNPGTSMKDMYTYSQKFAEDEHLTLTGKKKGNVLRNGVQIGTFTIDAEEVE